VVLAEAADEASEGLMADFHLTETEQVVINQHIVTTIRMLGALLGPSTCTTFPECAGATMSAWATRAPMSW